MPKRILNICLLAIPVGILLYLYANSFHEYPQFIHAWANYDYLALAHGFIQNGFDFFHPQTYVFNHQFPDNFTTAQATTITSVDFPIHAYFVGILMALFGSKSPFIFYAYQFFWVIIGLIYAHKLFLTISKKQLVAFYGVLFAITSTVYVYYIHSLIPTIPSLSTCFIGLYFLASHLFHSKPKHFYLGLFFLTLSALTRLPFAIPIIAYTGCVVFYGFIAKKYAKKTLLMLCLSAAIIFAYFLYNGTIRNTYGSMFLGSLLPPDNWEHATTLLCFIYTKWFAAYFSGLSWLLLAVAFFTATGLVIRKKLNKHLVRVLLFCGIYLLGCIMYLFLMLTQFKYHDYYFLDTFFIPLILLFVISLSKIYAFLSSKIKPVFTCVIFAFLCYSTFEMISNVQRRRRLKPYEIYQKTVHNFIKNKEWLHTLNLEKDARILALNPYMPNALFSIMEKSGYAVLRTNEQNIVTALTWDYDYIIIQDELFLADILDNHPTILQNLTLINQGNGLSLYTYQKKDIQSEAHVRLAGKQYHQIINDANITFRANMPFVDIANFPIDHIQNNCQVVYHVGSKIKDSQKPLLLVIEIWDAQKERILYNTFPIKPNQVSQKNIITLDIPKNKKHEALQMKLYFWNKYGVSGKLLKHYFTVAY